ncbi:hypothetical protein PoB_003740300 [Plakobranchus ocellatus]|uniref:Uncharacterized protein n=1 Tax=Plakobranchus ocellatus TaxID=259542 RepID=A0AAV4AU25_9GAST|nr:hypothetical protein PoB_003740300 [Plakobranchus ocellatus]
MDNLSDRLYLHAQIIYNPESYLTWRCFRLRLGITIFLSFLYMAAILGGGVATSSVRGARVEVDVEVEGAGSRTTATVDRRRAAAASQGERACPHSMLEHERPHRACSTH